MITMITMITQFNKVSLTVLRRDLDEALAVVAARHGITLKTGHISYQDRTCSIKVEAGIINPETGTAATKEAEAFKQLAPIYDLKPGDLGRSIPIKGAMYKIVGLKPGSSVRPIVLEDHQGRRIVAPARMVLTGLAR